MKAMGLSNNMFQGTIHTEFGLITELFDLQLFGNKFEGSIPSELALMTGLMDLGLSNNMLVRCLQCWAYLPLENVESHHCLVTPDWDHPHGAWESHDTFRIGAIQQ